MQLADSVSVAKIKIIAHNRARRTLIWRSCAFNRRPMTMPILDGVKPMAITLPICGTSESSFWKRKKKHILLDSVETNLNIWRVRWPSPRQVRVQIPTSPRQVRDDRKTSRVRTFFPRWCEQRDNLKCLVLRDCLWFCFYYKKKNSGWIFTMTGWLFSHTAARPQTPYKSFCIIGPLWNELRAINLEKKNLRYSLNPMCMHWKHIEKERDR